MAKIKRCEMCLAFINCAIYEKICEDFPFLSENLFDMKESQEIAKHCKKFKE